MSKMPRIFVPFIKDRMTEINMGILNINDFKYTKVVTLLIRLYSICVQLVVSNGFTSAYDIAMTTSSCVIKCNVAPRD